MAFIIPNALKTASGEKFENLDQSEPDSLDFEVLGNVGRSGVLSGCAVTALSVPGQAVQIANGIIVLNGKPYSVSGSVSFALPAAPTDNRFDLIVARVSGGLASFVAVSGNDETANPYFPDSSEVINVAYDAASNINLSTDVVIAAIYRQGSSTITTSRIADRRVFITSTIVDQGSAAPSASYGDVGSIYFKTGTGQGTTSSGVYVKSALGTWLELAQNTGPQVPVGTVIPWLGTTAAPNGYIEADGSAVSRTTYSELFAVLGTTYGVGDGSTTFNLPNLNEKHLKGTTTTGTVGSNTGNDSFTLTTDQLPSHSHSLAGHTHTAAHSHVMTHGHNGGSVSAGGHGHTVSADGTAANTGNHSHTDGNYSGTTTTHNGHTHGVSGNSGSAGNHNHSTLLYWNAAINNTDNRVYRRTSYVSSDGGYYAIPFYNTSPGSGMAVTAGPEQLTSHSGHSHDDGTYDADTGGNHSHTLNVGGNSGNTGAHSHNVSANGNAANAGAHTHTINVGGFTGNTQSTTPTTSASNVSSGNTGTGASINKVPASTYTRWLIRYAGSNIATASDGSEILNEALEEVVTVELVGSGASLPSSLTSAGYYRMPWAATLTGVKANLNGTATSAITIDVNEGGTSVLSTEITIDATESSSLDAATPAVISDSAIANDALLTFDIDSADTGDSGPLTVTLYFTRNA